VKSRTIEDPLEVEVWAEHVAALQATLFRPGSMELVFELDEGQLRVRAQGASAADGREE
jgi:hypothetical protein